MCGYWYSNNTTPSDEDLINIKRRGPDGFSRIENNFGNFSHALLITKPPRYDQPAANDHGVMLYNGSIYNVPGNDTDWILGQLDNNISHCIDVIKSLRGEYSLTFVTEDFIIFCTDVFNTRNLWYYFDDNTISVCSTPDVLRKHHTGAWPCEENKIYILNKHTWTLEKVENKIWDLQQTVNNFDKVFEKFETAISDRWNELCFLPLSSGYDSGIIACYLHNKGIKVPCAAFKGKEDIQILGNRLNIHKGHILRDNGSPAEYAKSIAEFTKQKHSKGIASDRFREISLYSISKGYRIHVTGRGADELYSDYGNSGNPMSILSRFGGYFPQRLELLWPWHNTLGQLTDGVTLQDFLYGFHGIEARVPLIDTELVQAWLNTTQHLKNYKFKAWIAEYMDMYKYPYDKTNLKIAGFPSI